MVVEAIGLPSDRGMGEVDLVVENEAVRRRDANRLLAVDDLDRLADAQHRDVDAECAYAGGIDEVHERKRAAVDDRDFGAVDEDVDVGHAAGVERGQEVLDRADRDVVATDRRRVIERGGRGLQRRDAQAVEVRAHELDAVAGGRGDQLDARVDAGMHPDAGDADVCIDGFALYVHVHGRSWSRDSATNG